MTIVVAARVTVAQSVKKKNEKSRIYANNGNNFIITKAYCFFSSTGIHLVSKSPPLGENQGVYTRAVRAGSGY